MKIKKTLCMALTGVLAAGMLAGCGSSKDSSKGVTLKVLTNRTDILNTDLKKFADDYKAKTGVTIKWEALKDYEGDVKVRMNSGNYGDVLLIPESLKTKDLPTYFESLGKTSDSTVSKYKINDLKATNGETYGISYGYNAAGIVYNKAAFKKAGVDPANVKTYDQFYEACDKLKKAGVTPIATNFKDKWPLSKWVDMGVCASGDSLYRDMLYKQESVFGESTEVGKAMKVLGTVVNKGYVEADLTTTNWDESKTDLGNGKFGMMIAGTWAIQQIKDVASNKDDIGFMAFPSETGKQYTMLGPDWSLGVSKKSKNKEEAKKFLFAFLDSDFADKHGYIPNNTSLKSSDEAISSFMNDSSVTQVTQKPVPESDRDKFKEICDKAQISIDAGTYAQDAMLGAKKSMADFDKAINTLNDKYNKAKKELGY